MRVAVYNGPGRPITIERLDDPRPAAAEIVVKIGRCGICGSDLSMTAAGPFSYPDGCKLGHEYAGEVVELGRDVHTIKRGDRVACVPAAGCGHCAACKDGIYLMCPALRPMVGGFGDYIAVPAGNAVVLPRSLSLSDGALVEPMACGLHALRLAGLRAGARILVLGAGSMALSVVYWGRLLGAGTIIVASRSAHRRDVAMTMGADGFHSFDDDAPEALMQKLGEAPDIVVECVGKSGMLNKAIDLVRPRGTVIAMGMCTQAEPILPIACTVKEVRLFFPYGYSLEEFVETAKVFDSGHVRPDLMVSDVIALEALPATIEAMRQGGRMLKVHVDPSLEPALV